MVRIKKLFFSIPFALLLYSCDPSCRVKYWINNKSDSTVYVIFGVQSDSLIQKLVVDKQSTMLLEDFEVSGSLHESNSISPTNFYDSLGIFIDTIDFIEIKIDYLNDDSWTYSQDNISHFGIIKVGDNVYSLEITNDHLK